MRALPPKEPNIEEKKGKKPINFFDASCLYKKPNM